MLGQRMLTISTTVDYPLEVDYFERESLEYYSGDTESFEIVDADSVFGDRSLRYSGFDDEILSVSGLRNYPRRGHVIQCYHLNEVSDSWFGFGVQDSDNMYRVEWVHDISIRKVVGGSVQDLAFEGTNTVDRDVWLRYVIEWGFDTIKFRAYDQNNELAHELEATDDEWDEGGIAFGLGGSTKAGSPQGNWDKIEVIEGVS